MQESIFDPSSVINKVMMPRSRLQFSATENPVLMYKTQLDKVIDHFARDWIKGLGSPGKILTVRIETIISLDLLANLDCNILN